MSDADRDKWNAIYAGRDRSLPPSELFVEVVTMLPTAGRALDIAGGAGRHGLLLAEHGLQVDIIDISKTALEMAKAEAARRRLTVTTIEQDLESSELQGLYDVVVCFHYLNRDLLATIPDHLQPNGLLLFVQPTTRNLERHDKPSARFLLEEAEMPSLFPSMEVVLYDEGWRQTGRHEARIVARKPEGQ